ncbi:replication protein A 70 kDa DNA-binding subunit B, partial [Tanacetum coccineum]
GNRVQATVRNHDIKKFQPILVEGACYRITKFGIDENSRNFQLLEHRFKLSFFKNKALQGLEVLTAIHEALGLSISVFSHQENSLRENFRLAKIKYFNEKPYVTPAMYSTKLYINNDIPKIVAFRNRYSEKDGFDPENHSIVQFTSVKKEVIAEDYFRGGIKTMVGHIRDFDSSFHCILYAKIHKIHRENVWTYLACNRCGRSAKEVDDDQSSSSGKRAKK